ncbi:MAG: hypothetical protein GY931_06190 [Maribacter sp.]|nr:hypothetical protein [Maribacter sp.]
MSKLKDIVANLKGLDYYHDQMFFYFDEFKGSDWTDISREAALLKAAMTGEPVHEDSPLACLIDAACAISYYSAVEHISAVLQIDDELIANICDPILPGKKPSGLIAFLKEVQKYPGWDKNTDLKKELKKLNLLVEK